jgi:UPF0755 protein
MRSLYSLLLFFLLSLCVLGIGMWRVLGPAGTSTESVVFIVPQQPDDFDITHALKEQGLIRNEMAFFWFLQVITAGKEIKPGGYRINSSMHAWTMSTVLTSPPQLVWVTIGEGMRKEQIGERIGALLGWSNQQIEEWNNFKADDVQYNEGVYFPDTYLLPIDEPVGAVAQRFIDRFNEKVGPLMDDFAAKDILWTTGVKIASLLEREAAGAHDMPLVAGVIWNRLDQDMKLDIDATLQYIKGNEQNGWWTRVVPADKSLDSPYNSYKYKGLPPGPISNPGLTALEAVLNPQETECLFYLHAPNKDIHCAVTYAEHLENIKKYL